MKTLIQHIEYLLLHKTEVSVGRLGVFYIKNVPAFFDPISSTLIPTQNKILFRQHNSEDNSLLIKSYMRKYHISEYAASEKINAGVSEIIFCLQNNKKLKLGDLGYMILSPLSGIHFQPVNKSLSCFPVISIKSKEKSNINPHLEEKGCTHFYAKEIEDSNSKDYYFIRIRKKLAKLTAASFLFLFLLASTIFFILNDTIKRNENIHPKDIYIENVSEKEKDFQHILPQDLDKLDFPFNTYSSSIA